MGGRRARRRFRACGEASCRWTSVGRRPGEVHAIDTGHSWWWHGEVLTNMNRHPWILLALAGALTSGCVSRSAYDEKVDELQQAKAQLRQVSDIAQQYGSQVDGLESERSK